LQDRDGKLRVFIDSRVALEKGSSVFIFLPNLFIEEGIIHTSIRRYKGLIPDRIEELIKRDEEGFVPIVSSGEGFVSFRFGICRRQASTKPKT
jgi:hypothetical protein